MNTYDFTYKKNRTGEVTTVTIDQDDEVLNVTLDGVYLGNMVPDAQAEFGYSTENEELKPEIKSIAFALNEIDAMNNLPAALHQMYGDNLIGWTWTDNKDLKVIAHPDVDLIEFTGVIRDQIHDVVLFEKPLLVYLSKEGSGQVEEIHVNS